MVSQSNAYATRQPWPIVIYMKPTIYVVQYAGPQIHEQEGNPFNMHTS